MENLPEKKERGYWFRGYVAIIGSILFLISSIIITTAKDEEMYGVGPLILGLFWFIIFLTTALMGPLSITKGIRFKDRNYIFAGIISLIILFVSIMVLYS